MDDSSFLSLIVISALYDEIRQFREACGDAHMKTILAVGELGTFTNVYKASLVSMMAGEDIKHRKKIVLIQVKSWRNKYYIYKYIILIVFKLSSKHVLLSLIMSVLLNGTLVLMWLDGIYIPYEIYIKVTGHDLMHTVNFLYYLSYHYPLWCN